MVSKVSESSPFPGIPWNSHIFREPSRSFFPVVIVFIDDPVGPGVPPIIRGVESLQRSLADNNDDDYDDDDDDDDDDYYYYYYY